jgi:putative DNA primase/helicase
MRQDFFDYLPTFKLVIAGNHRPSLRSVDEAIRRRFNLIPFLITIPPEQRDGELMEKLKAERPGILSWAIKGCGDWLKEGLNPPKAVRDATANYLAAEDAIASWLDERCTRDLKAWESSSALFDSWKAWADRAGENPGNMRRFVQALETRGFVWERKTRGRGFAGLRFADDERPL